MPLPRRRTLALTLAALLALPLTPGCGASPTLPLPPPYADDAVVGTDGFVTIEGTAIPESLVYGFNQQTESGVIVKATKVGTFSMRLQASAGDLITIFMEIGVERSDSGLVHVLAKAK